MSTCTFCRLLSGEPTITIQDDGTFEICLTETITYDACGTGSAGQTCSETVCHTLIVTETNVAVIADWMEFGPVCNDDAIVDLDEFVGTKIDISRINFNNCLLIK